MIGKEKEKTAKSETVYKGYTIYRTPKTQNHKTMFKAWGLPGTYDSFGSIKNAIDANKSKRFMTLVRSLPKQATAPDFSKLETKPDPEPEPKPEPKKEKDNHGNH